jgi:phage shock protein PspC (stress-responsive transcriptional regulator)
MLERLKHIIESGVFGVCTYLGDKMGIATSRIRLFFIYATFLTLGSPVIVYMSMAFLLKLRNYMRGFMSPLKDL